MEEEVSKMTHHKDYYQRIKEEGDITYDLFEIKVTSKNEAVEKPFKVIRVRQGDSCIYLGFDDFSEDFKGYIIKFDGHIRDQMITNGRLKTPPLPCKSL